MTLKETAVGQTVKVKKLTGEDRLREGSWIWGSQKVWMFLSEK